MEIKDLPIRVIFSLQIDYMIDDVKRKLNITDVQAEMLLYTAISEMRENIRQKAYKLHADVIKEIKNGK